MQRQILIDPTLEVKSSSAQIQSRLTILEHEAKPSQAIYSRTFNTLPIQVSFDDVDSQGRLKNPGIEVEKIIEDDVARKVEKDLKDRGYIAKEKIASRYGIIYCQGEFSFRGYVYNKPLYQKRASTLHLVNRINDGSWFVAKYIADQAGREFKFTHDMGLALFDINEHLFVMKLISGINLWDYLKTHPIRPAKQNLQIISSMFESLLEAHKKNIIHCDVKPLNFIVVNPCKVALIDYGISWGISSDDSTISLENVGGTPFYRAPEVSGFLSLKSSCGYKLDGYSLAASIVNVLSSKCANYQYIDFSMAIFLEKDIDENSDEFKQNTQLPPLARLSVLKLLNRMSKVDPKERLSPQQAFVEFKEIGKQNPILPLTKAIVSMDELNILLLELKKIDSLSRFEMKYFSEVQKLFLESKQFLQALKMFDIVLLAESKEHNLIECSRVHRFLTNADFSIEEWGKRISATGIQINSELFFAGKEVNILDVVAGIPKVDSKSDDDNPADYVFVTRESFTAKTDILILSPQQILQDIKLDDETAQSEMNATLLKSKGIFSVTLQMHKNKVQPSVVRSFLS